MKKKISLLMIAVLAGSATASMTGQPAESRWNLLDLLPRKPVQAAGVVNPEERLAAAEKMAAGGQPERAVLMYRLFLDECPLNATCAAHLDRARLGIGQALAASAEDAPVAKEAVTWLEAIETRELIVQAEPARLRMRALLAKNGLSDALSDTRHGDWNDAAVRVENYAAEYPETTADEKVRKYLAALRDSVRSGAAVPESGLRMAERAEQLLSSPAVAALPRTIAVRPAAPRPERLPSFQSAVAGASANGGAAFDGSSNDRSPVSVSLSMRNGQPNEVSVSAGNWNVSVGQLGVGDRSGLLAESPYVNVRRVTRSPIDSAIDRRLELQAGVIQINSRFFGDGAQSDSFDRLSDMGRRLGLPDGSIASLRSRFAVEDPWRSELGILAGGLAQFGRAARIPLPFESPVAVDLAWSATMLAKASGYAPNVAANASAGMRVTLPSGHQGALIGGWTEEVQPLGHDFLSDLARGNGAKVGLGREGSPQATAVISGPIPGTVVDFELGASQRWAATVVEQKVQAGLSSTLAGKPVSVRMSLKDEHGKTIEYGRRGAEVEASLTFAPGSSIYALCEKERISYGGVDVSNDGCLTGLRWMPGAAVTLNADVIFGGRDKVSDKGTQEAAALAASIGRLGAAGLEVTDNIAKTLDPEAALGAALTVISRLPTNEVAAALDAIAASPLPPQTKELIAGLISQAANGANTLTAAELRRVIEQELGPIPDVKKEYASRRSMAVEAIGLLSDPGFWDGAVQSAVRSQILASVSELKVSVGPLGTLRITPASALLLAGAARYNGSPVSPLTQDAADMLFQKTVRGELGRLVGGPVGGDSFAIANALINRTRDAFASALETDVIARLPRLTDRIALADQALSYLPPEVAARLRAQLGADLGLSSLDNAGVIAVLRALPEQAAKDLRANMAPEAAKALDQALALAAQSVRREINRAVLQLMLASEEFDRLTVDRGMKPGDLGARMISESFKRLDERNRRDLRTRRAGSIERLRTRIVEESHEAAVADAGSFARTLETLRAAPGWPAGLHVRVDTTTRTELVKVYGEDALSAAVARLAVGLPAGTNRDIVIAYDASELGSRLDRGADGALRLTLGKPAHSPEFSLDTAITVVKDDARRHGN
ncbi:MAG: hypothetical protein HY923_01745 [Elusimicrobia bacterium]|nr:hypothetical protein [Elusimicrobiota bacterium]